VRERGRGRYVRAGSSTRIEVNEANEVAGEALSNLSSSLPMERRSAENRKLVDGSPSSRKRGSLSPAKGDGDARSASISNEEPLERLLRASSGDHVDHCILPRPELLLPLLTDSELLEPSELRGTRGSRRGEASAGSRAR